MWCTSGPRPHSTSTRWWSPCSWRHGARSTPSRCWRGCGPVIVVADDAVGDIHAGLDHAVVGRGLADLGAPEGVRELEDAPLELALLLAGGVVAAVLLEVALLTRRADALHDLGALGALE